MKPLLLTSIAITFIFIATSSNVLAAPITADLVIASPPPGTFVKDIIDLAPITAPSEPAEKFFHVGIQPGITDLHIHIPPQTDGFDSITVRQNLFTNAQSTISQPIPGFSEVNIDLSGGLLAFDTNFRVSVVSPLGHNLSFDIRATVPEPSTWLLLASSLAALILWRRRTHSTRESS